MFDEGTEMTFSDWNAAQQQPDNGHVEVLWSN
jgi:hypothetical protein